MGEVDADHISSDGLILTPKVALFVAVGIPAFSFLLDDLLGLIEGGGIFSVGSALGAASEGVAVIDVDSAGLRTIFMLLCSIAVIVPSTILRANLTKRLVSLAVVVPIIAGGFIFDSIFDERIVGNLIASHGYTRCENGDFHVGNGKSRVWFDNYVLSQTSCPPTPRRS